MNERIEKLMDQSLNVNWYGFLDKDCVGQFTRSDLKKFAELILQDMHRKVIASILITDVVMEEKGQKPTSEDYIQAINKDFGVES